MAAPSPWDDAFFDDGDREEYDAFFDNAGGDSKGALRPSSGGASSSRDPVVPRSQQACEEAGDADDIESEYAFLDPKALAAARQLGSGDGGTVSPGQSVVAFQLDDDEDLDMDMVQSEYKQDCRPPEVPEAPDDFSPEDMRLREVLTNFYFRNRAENLANINLIIKRYRGAAVSHLWAQLAAKYKVAPHDVLELLASSMYADSPFEYAEERRAEGLQQRLVELREALLDRSEDIGVAEVLRNFLQRGASGDPSCSSALRMLCFRGLPHDCGELRPQVWRVLLGCCPADRPEEWDTIQSEMRTLYGRCKADILVVSIELKLQVKVEGGRLMEAMHLLQQIQKDVDRTQQEVEQFRRPATKVALISLLFVYANQNPDVGYVQGMNEVAAAAFHAVAVDPEFEEADAFWCFSYLMRELKNEFLQGLEATADHPSSGVTALESLLRSYDPELHRHLQRCGCPTRPFAFRWCTLLFAQDMPLADVVRLWDCFIADPRRFEFVSHVGLAALVLSREELLRDEDTGRLAEVIRRLPRQADFDTLLRRARAITAFQRRVQTPPFPMKSTAQVVQDLSGWARTAASRAQEIVAQSVQQNVTPSVKDKVSQASGVSGVVAQGGVKMAQGGVQALKTWFEQDAPIQPETALKAQEKVLKAQEKAASLLEAGRAAGVPELAQGGVRRAQGGVQAVKAWLEQDTPVQPETAARAQARASSLWQAGTAGVVGGLAAKFGGPRYPAQEPSDPPAQESQAAP